MLTIGIHRDEGIDRRHAEECLTESRLQRCPFAPVPGVTYDEVCSGACSRRRGLIRRAIVDHDHRHVRSRRADSLNHGSDGLLSLIGRDHARRSHHHSARAIGAER